MQYYSLQPATYNAPQVIDLAKALEVERAAAADYVVDGADLRCRVERSPELVFGEGRAPKATVRLEWTMDGETHSKALTRWAQTQLASRCDIPIRYWDKMLDGCKDDLLADNVNAWLPDMTDRRLRTFPDVIRAIVSHRFKAIDNYDVILTAAKATRGTTATIQRATVTESRLYVRMIDLENKVRIEDGSEVNPGVVVRNSEVGHGALVVAPFVWRQVCSNGMMMDSVLREVHLGGKIDPGLLSSETIALEGELVYSGIEDVIGTVFRDHNRFQTYIDHLNDGMKTKIADIPKLVETMTVRRQIDKTEADELINLLATDRTIQPEHRGTEFAFRMGVSALARDTPDGERQAELEQLAAKIKIEDLQEM